MSKPKKTLTLAEKETESRELLTSALKATLTADQATRVLRMLDNYVDAMRNVHQVAVDDAAKDGRSEGLKEGNAEGFARGKSERRLAWPFVGQVGIDTVTTLRRLETHSACPFQTKAWRALADSVERG